MCDPYHVVASKVEEKKGIVLVASIEFVTMVLVQICGQRLCFSEKVDLPCVRHVKHLHDETAVDSLKLEVPLYRYSKANPDDAEAIFSAQGVGGISEGGEQCYQASAELGTECWVVFPVGKAVDRGILLQQLVRGIREGVKDIFRRHALPTGELVVGKIDVLEDIIKDAKGRGKITGCVRACEDVVRPVLDHDMLRGAQYPDAGAAAVATYVYAQTAVGQLYVSNGKRITIDGSINWADEIDRLKRSRTHASSRLLEVS